MTTIKLEATSAKRARSEIASRFPQGANYKGFDEDGEVVLMSLVRARGSKANVRFEAEPLT